MRRGLTLAALLLVLFSRAAHANTVTWSGAAGDGGIFTTPGNWVGNVAPLSTDSVTFSASTVACSITSSVTVAAISISVNVTITQSAGVTVSITGNFTQSNGTFTANGLLTIGGTFNKTAGTFNTNGGTVMLTSTTSRAFTTTGSTSFNNLVINDGLVGYWKLDDSGALNTTATDASGYANNGTTSATGTTWQTDAPTGMDFADSGSISLDGSAGYVTLGASNLPATNAAQTISLWAKPANTTQNGDMIVLKGGSSTGLQLKIQAGTAKVTSIGGTSLISTTAPSAGNWHHIAYTYDGASHQTLYVDGTATTATATNQTGAATVAYLGTYNAANELFNGSLDEVRVYNRVLSATDIATLASGAQPGTGVAVQTMSGSPLISGDLTIASGTLAGGTNSFSVRGSWWNYGMFSGTGTVTFNGTGLTELHLVAGDPPAGLTISGTGSWSIVDGSVIPLTLTGSYTQSAGTFTAGSGLFNIAGSFNKTGGTFNGGGGRVMLSASSGTQNFATSGTTSFTNLDHQ